MGKNANITNQSNGENANITKSMGNKLLILIPDKILARKPEYSINDGGNPMAGDWCGW